MTTVSPIIIQLDNIQAELNDLDFIETSKTLLVKFSKNNFIIFTTLSTLRRIRDIQYVEKIATDLLYTFFALFDFFYLSAKEIIKNQGEGSDLESNADFKSQILILKELTAILGNIVKYKEHSKPFLDKSLHLVLIDLNITFIRYPKLIKNTIGALINLTTDDEIREQISKVAAFIRSVYIILEHYKDNYAIIDYLLKLIINVISNGK